jgi:hypothetical protein
VKKESKKDEKGLLARNMLYSIPEKSVIKNCTLQGPKLLAYSQTAYRLVHHMQEILDTPGGMHYFL